MHLKLKNRTKTRCKQVGEITQEYALDRVEIMVTRIRRRYVVRNMNRMAEPYWKVGVAKEYGRIA